MNYRILANILGGLLVILGLIVAIPGIYSELAGAAFTSVFFFTSCWAIGLGSIVYILTRRNRGELNHRTGFAVVTFSWITACLLGAIPYYLSVSLPSFVDCIFESTSGFSGTGASVILNIERMDRGILLWRSMTQWLGGMGIIVFFLAILPVLGMGGVQLFRAETTGPSKDKITPRVKDTARNLWLFYLGFTALLALSLITIGNMSIFDAVNHAMTTLSTGGFSTRNAGVGAFDSAAVDYLIALFMLIGSINFSLHYYLLIKRDRRSLFDTELKAYFWVLLVAILSITFVNWQPSGYESLSYCFRKTIFTVLATASSTGYTNADYLAWPWVTHFMLVLLMVMGGMSGSTAGGMKCIRFVAAVKLILKDLKQVVHPSAVLPVKVNDRSIRPNIAAAIWGFLFLYALVFAILTLILTFEGLDIISASTATISALSNIGPAFGELGPFDNYEYLSDVSKLTLNAGMVIGRLEFFTVIVLLTPEYWRK